jgi:histone acetyltransferase
MTTKNEQEVVETEGETGIGFSKRNLNVQREEESGEVSFKVITNDDTHENLIYLTHLKNIISKQLPKMPKEYIVRLVFDKKHESMILIKDKKKVVGGVCYRPNFNEKFIEIAFLAISHTEQVKGYGTRLMNKLKDHCRTKDLEYFLTYADNNAIGYFKKQGFSNAIKTPIEVWKDLIKDYDGGTLMEAYVNPRIEYSKLSNNLQLQKEFLINACKRFLNVKRLRSHDELEKIMKKHEHEVRKTKFFLLIFKIYI